MLKWILRAVRRVRPLRLDDNEQSRWAVWRWKYIRDDQGEDYLTRLVLLKTPLFSVRLHWIHRADYARDAHDHPWNFCAVVLSGGYMETESEFDVRSARRLSNRVQWVGRFGINVKKMRQTHCITEVEPDTVTLFMTGRWQEQWGFWVPTGLRVHDGPAEYDAFEWVDADAYHANQLQETA